MAAGFSIRVKTNAATVQQEISRAVLEQAPFAAARGLTWTALNARDAVRKNLHRVFKIRNQRVPRGIQIAAAKKRDWPRPTAVVGSRDEFMVMHATGGTKKARRSSPGTGPARIAVPTSKVRRTSKGKVPKPLRPRVLLRPGGRGVLIGSDGRSTGIIRKIAPKRRTRGSIPPPVLHFLVRQARIRKTWPFRANVEKAVRGTLGRNMRRSFALAIRDKR